MKVILALAVGMLGMAGPTAAATYNFVWSADTTAPGGPVTSDDPSIRAIGTLDINVANGAAFDFLDVSNINIALSSDNFSTVTILFDGIADNIRGTVSADGASASVTELFTNFDGGGFFGCTSPGCPDSTVRARPAAPVGLDPGPESVFASQADALASFVITRAEQPEVIPLPAAGWMLLAGAGALGAVGMRRRRHV